MIHEPFASYPDVVDLLDYYRDRALNGEARIAKLERLLRNVLAVTADDRPSSIPLPLRREIREALTR